MEEDFGCESELRRGIGELVNFLDLLGGESRHSNFSQEGMENWEDFLDGDCRDVVLVVLTTGLLFKEFKEALMQLCYRVSGVSICHCILLVGPRRRKWGQQGSVA